jgi:hypothetical protein
MEATIGEQSSNTQNFGTYASSKRKSRIRFSKILFENLIYNINAFQNIFKKIFWKALKS